MSLRTKVKYIFTGYWSYLVAWLTPLVLLPLPLVVQGQVSSCGYMLAIMAIYWMTEAIPLGATGLLPVALAPLLGILSMKEVCSNYLTGPIMFFTGAIVIALATERCDLNKRIALTVLVATGTQLKWLLLGFTLTTCLISVFVTNTATTAMMLPIVDAILEQLENIHQNPDLNDEILPLKKDEERGKDEVGNNSNSLDKDSGLKLEIEEGKGAGDTNKYKNFAKCLTLMSAYASKCGGVAALTGCSINVVLKGFADQFWQEHGFNESPVTYSSWLMFGLPISAVNIILIWLWMSWYHLGISSFKCTAPTPEETQVNTRIRNCLRKERELLGPMKFSEYVVCILLFLLVLLWFFRVPGFMVGWGNLFQDGYVGPATPTILVAILLFAIPFELKGISGEAPTRKRMKPLMDWDTVHKKMPWKLIFLMGGGFALAHSCEKSGLTLLIGNSLAVLTRLNSWLLIFLICLVVTFITEVISMAATCSILVPIVYSMANALGKNPLYLMLPVAISTAYAHMLPVSSPPNALSFASGRFTLLEMAKGGAAMNFLCAITVTIATQTYGDLIFDFHTSPWSSIIENVANSTDIPVVYQVTVI